MRARILIGAITGTLALAGGRPASAQARPDGDPLPARPLATAWPAHIDCPAFERVDVEVDDRVEAVEWRGPGGASRTFAVARPADPQAAWQGFRLRSWSLDGIGVMASSRILYTESKENASYGFRAARATQPIGADFPVGRLDRLTVRPRRPSPAGSRAGGPPDPSPARFGLLISLRCADPSRASLRWICDGATCVPRALRDNPDGEKAKAGTRSSAKDVIGPYRRDWIDGKRAPDLARLLCARPAQADAGATRRYRVDGYLGCARRPPLRADSLALGELARDLVAELDRVVEFGCGAGACSASIDRLRATARRLLEPAPLALRSARGRFDAGDRGDPQWPESLGWVARLGRGDVGVEIACASHNDLDSDGEPPHNQCRLTVLDHGRALAHYYPHWHQQVELPDRGAIHLQGSADNGTGDLGDQIVIIGSALALAPGP